MAEYKSKTVTVPAPPAALYGKFTDLEGLLAAVPQEQRSLVNVDGDSFRLNYAGFTIEVRITEKVPYSKIVCQGVETPFPFTVTIHLDNGEFLNQTSLMIEINAELNFMMKTLLGSRIQEFLDKFVMAIATGQVLG